MKPPKIALCGDEKNLCGRGPSPKAPASFPGPYTSWLVGKPRNPAYLDRCREKTHSSPSPHAMYAMPYFFCFWGLALEINPNKPGFAVFLVAMAHMDPAKWRRGRRVDLAHRASAILVIGVRIRPTGDVETLRDHKNMSLEPNSMNKTDYESL